MGTFAVYLVGLLVVGGVLFLAAAFVFGRGEELAPAPKDSTPLELPEDRPVTSRDLRGVRIPVVVRGYRMTEVDWLIDELATSLDDRDREIARLRGELAPAPPQPDPVDPPADGPEHPDG